MNVVPAVLAVNSQEFEKQLTAVAPLSERIHIDIADGIFVPTTTVSISSIVIYFADNPKLYRNKKFDFHLMVEDWQNAADQLTDLEELIHINLVLPHYSVFVPDQTFPHRLGITFNPEDEIDTTILDEFEAVQIMTVHPGKQGSPFLPDACTKITQLRKSGYKGEIIIDGGVNDKTIPFITESEFKPDTLSVGSYLTQAADPQKNYAHLVRKIA